MSTEIIEGDFLITTFMGYTYSSKESEVWKYVYYDLHYYSGKWELLMPACYKWDDIFKECAVDSDIAIEYENRCDLLDNAVSLYEILPAFNQLVENVKWYQNQILNNTINHG